jgi:hypothetical protein
MEDLDRNLDIHRCFRSRRIPGNNHADHRVHISEHVPACTVRTVRAAPQSIYSDRSGQQKDKLSILQIIREGIPLVLQAPITVADEVWNMNESVEKPHFPRSIL